MGKGTNENLIKETTLLEEQRSVILKSIKDKEIWLNEIDEEFSPKKRNLKNLFNLCFYGINPGLTKKQFELIEKISFKEGSTLKDIIKKNYVGIEKEIKDIRSKLSVIEKKIILKSLFLYAIKEQDIIIIDDMSYGYRINKSSKHPLNKMIVDDNYSYKLNYVSNNLFIDFLNKSDRLEGEIHRPPNNKKEKNYLEHLKLISSSNNNTKTIPDKLVDQFYKSIIKKRVRNLFLLRNIESKLKSNPEESFQDYFGYKKFIVCGSPSDTTRELIEITKLPYYKTRILQDENMCIKLGAGETLDDVISDFLNL